MNRINILLIWVISILLMFMFFSIIAQVVSRYIINSSLHWTEEAARFLIIWTVFLGVAVAMRQNSLISVEILVQSLSLIYRRIILIFSLLFTSLLMLYLTYLGVNLTINAANQASTALGLPMWLPYAAVPVGSFFTFLNAIAVLLELLIKTKEEEQIN